MKLPTNYSLTNHICISIWTYSYNILTFDRAVNQETGASNQRYWNITLTCGRVEFSADAMPTGSRWTSNNYLTRCHRWFESVGVRGRQSSFQVAVTVRVPVAVGDAVVRVSAWQRAWTLRTPVEQPSRMRKKCCYRLRNLGSICSSLFLSPTHLSHITNINPFATLLRIKCERYIFIKKWVHC